MAAATLALLGGFKLRSASGDVLRLRSRKTQALLAYLATRLGDEQPRDKLTALLWGDRTDAQARDSLRHALTEIRKVVGPAVVAARERSVVLQPDAVDVDVAALQRHSAAGGPASLEQAVALYRGDFLEGFVVAEPAFESWLVGERERYRELALETLARLLALQSGADQLDRAIQTAVRLLALDPLQEAVHRTLMRLYTRQGRRGAALRQYQLCVAALQREMETEPEPETTALYREVLRDRPGAAPRGGRPAQPDTVSAAVSTDADDAGSDRTAGDRSGMPIAVAAPELPVYDTPLIGRAGELARLRRLYEHAGAGRGSAVVVSGEAGVGKSRLVAELAADALARDGRVLLGRCYPSTQILPFGPWVDAMRRAGVIGAAALEAIGPAWRAELARLFPEAAVAGLPVSSENPTRLFEAIARLVQEVARPGPVVIILEDCHWADEMTLSLVAFAARRIGSWPVLLAVTVREDETADAPLVQRTLAEIREEPAAHALALAPLAHAEIADLVQQALGPDVPGPRAEQVRRRVWAVSEGNPFVALEALRAWRSESGQAADATLPVPGRVRELVTARLAGLSDTARKLVGVAAALGRECDFALLQRAAELSEDAAASGVEELVRRRILGGVGERFHFTHDRIREVAHAELLPQRRRLIHARVVTALETVHADRLDEHTLTLAQHCQEAALWDKGVAYWRRAAAQAAERSALRQAVECLEAALTALDRLPGDRRDVVEQAIDVRLDLRAALFAGEGGVDRVGDLLAEAAALASEIGDDRRLARILVMQAHYYGIITCEMTPAEATARRALAIAHSLDAPGLVARAGSLLGRVQHGRAAYADAIETLTRNVEFVDSMAAEDDWTLVLPVWLGSRVWLTFALAETGRFAEAMAIADEAVGRVDARPTHPYRRYHAYWARVAVHLEQGDHQRATQEMNQMLGALRETDMQLLPDNLSGLAGRAHALAGRIDEAVSRLEQAVAGARDAFSGHRDMLYLGEAYLDAGRGGDALGYGERALDLARRRGQAGYQARALWLLATIRRESGDHARGETLYLEALALADELGMRPWVAHGHAGLAVLYARCAQSADSARHAGSATTLYGRLQTPHWQRVMERQLVVPASA